MRRALGALACVLAAATCTSDQGGPSTSGRGYFAFRPSYGLAEGASLAQFGIVADSVRVRLTRPVDVVVLDTTVFFPPDSTALHLALPVSLKQSPETLDAVVEIRSAGSVIFVDSFPAEIKDGPPGTSDPATAVLDYVGPGRNIADLTIAPPDTTVALGDTLFFTATATDSSAASVANFYVAWRSSDTTLGRINAQGRFIASGTRGTVRVTGFTPTGIADTTTLVLAPVPVIITRDSGNAQSGLAGDSLAALFVARVKGADSLGIAGISVRFQAVTVGGAIRDTFLVTDAQGRVRTRALLGTGAGTYNYSATVVGTGITTTFSATATPAAPSTIAIQSGNGQVDSAGRALPNPFTVLVTDAFGNPVPSVEIAWTLTAGSGVLSFDTTTTGGSGLSLTSFTLGAVGVDSITANIVGTSASVVFVATAINGAPAFVVVDSGNAQTGAVGQALTDSFVVTVTSATGQAVVGTNVTWTVFRGGSVSPATTPTDVNGRAATQYTTGTTPGVDSIHAQAGVNGTFFTATVVTGAPSAMALVSGSGQTDTAGRTLANPFVVHVVDAFGNDVSGAQVAWNVIRGGSPSLDTTVTGVNGQASVSYTLGLVPGVDSVQAHLVGTAATIDFTANVEVLTASQLFLISGDAQTDTVARVLLPMVVEAQASDARVVDSTTIQWVIASGSGFLSAPSTLTDSTGRTSNTLTLPVAPGSTTVLAILPGQDTVTFTATATPDAPTSFTIQSGGAPAPDTVDATLPQFVVQATDSFGNPRAGLEVVWSRIAGSGTPALDTVVTDAGGLAFFTYVLGPTPGADTVRAALSVTGATIDFAATTLPGLADSIAILTGDAQVDTVGQQLPIFPQVQVLDRHGNGVDPTPVAFVVTAGSGSPSPDTVVTVLGGFAGTGFTLGTTAGTETLEARARGGAVVATFTFTAVPDAPTVIAKIGGDGQADTANAVLPIPLAVSVTDAYGNPIAGATVVFDPFAGGVIPSPDTVLTDALGHASSTLTLGPTPGADSVFVSVLSTGVNVTFTATTLAAAPASLNYVSGDAQSDTVARTLAAPFVVRMQDAGNNGVPGLMVTFAITSGGGGPSLSIDSALTDSLGFASTTLTLGTVAGNTTVRATSAAVTDTVVFSAFGANDLPAAIAVTSGTGQSVEVLQLAGASVDVEVTDAFGNTVNGAAVAWSTGGPGSSAFPDTSITSGTGDAAASFTAGPTIGTDSLIATLVGTSATVAVTFNVFAAPPVAISYVSGDSQSSVIGSPFAAPLTVLVTDSLGNPAAGALVSWQDSAGAGLGSFAPDTSVADVNGHATTTYTPASLAGGRTLQAFLVAAPSTVTFHGTALAGAPTSIVTDAGDTQSDTVFTTLALPLQVLVRDASSNPVGAAAITWVVVSGNATLNDSSTVTDSLGHSSVSVTFGGVSGQVAIRAILGAAVDSAVFHVTALPGQPATFLKISGDAQTAIVSSPVALPLVAQVQDVWGNGVPGQTVGMVIASGGGSLDSVETVTDSLGFARAVIWTLGATVGTNGVQMNWTSFFQDFTATALPIGTSKSWAGTTSTDWNDPNNWAPTGVPLASEGVYIPAGTPFIATLSSAAAVDALTLQAGATVETNGFILTASGDVRASTTITGLGTLEMSGAGTTLEGAVPNLLVTGSVTLSDSLAVAGNLTIDGGNLSLGAFTGSVVGNLTTQNGGYLRMQNPADTLTVLGSATFNGGDEGGSLTAGRLRVGGAFTVNSAVADAYAVGTFFTTELNGAVLQPISIAFPQSSTFGRLELTGAGGAQFLTDAVVQNGVTATGGIVSGVGRTVTVGTSGIQDGGTRWTVTNTILTGPAILTDSLHTNLTLRGSPTVVLGFRVIGDLTVRGAGAFFAPSGYTVAVTGDLVVDSSAALQLNTSSDSLLVAGNATFAGASTAGNLIDGVIRIGGHFAQAGDPQAFAPSVNQKVVFPAPVAYDSISFANPGASASRFHHVEFEGGGTFYHYFTGNAVVTGQMVVDFGAQVYNFNGNPDGKLTVTSKLPIGSGYWQVDMLEVAGNVVVDSATAINARVTRVTGATATLDVNGTAIFLSGDLDVRNSGLVRMVAPSGVLEVNGNASFGGRSTLGQLTDGVLYLHGDLTQLALTNTRSFQGSGNHTTMFLGTSEQLVTFGSPGPTSSRFQELQINNTGGVVFGSLAVVNGSVQDFNGGASGVVGVTIAGTLVDPNGNWRPATTTFTGGPTLPDSVFGSIVITGTLSPNAPLRVVGSLTISGAFGLLSLDDNPKITITDSLVTELGGTIDMTGTIDTIEVGKAAVFSGGSSFLAGGTLLLHGNFEQSGTADAFNAQAGFLTVLAPTGTDTVTFANPDSTAAGSGFADLRIEADGQRIVLATPVEVRGGLTVPFSAATDPVIEGNGNALTVHGDVNVDGVTFDRTPFRIHQTNNASAMTLANSAFLNFLSSDVQLRVSNLGTGAFMGNFNTLTFTPLTSGNTGFYLQVQDADGVGPNFFIGIVGSNVGNGPAFTSNLNGGSASWF